MIWILSLIPLIMFCCCYTLMICLCCLVLGLLSSEGVEGVALRIEMMVESGMDNEALKAVSAVVIALISG